QGLKAYAFILSQDHARIALSYGIRTLILHPGLPHSLNPEQDSRLAASLRGMMSNIRQLDAAAKILIYRHPLLMERLPFEELGADGYVDYQIYESMS
ncbi:MAG: hypothetical protein OIF54_17765, partial [Cohaesibacter sp.]|nr:hypothetical protein [Cohaesibacter sp.]